MFQLIVFVLPTIVFHEQSGFTSIFLVSNQILAYSGLVLRVGPIACCECATKLILFGTMYPRAPVFLFSRVGTEVCLGCVGAEAASVLPPSCAGGSCGSVGSMLALGCVCAVRVLQQLPLLGQDFVPSCRATTERCALYGSQLLLSPNCTAVTGKGQLLSISGRSALLKCQSDEERTCLSQGNSFLEVFLAHSILAVTSLLRVCHI
jgi:hypothetical protein